MKIKWNVVIFFLLAPLYVPLYLFMHLTFKWWEDLLG